MTADKDTIYAPATAPGEGAIAIVRLSGPDALRLLQQASGRRRFRPRRMSAVVLRDPQSGEVVDQALACYMPAPRSYTGQDVVEVYIHGGRLCLERTAELLGKLGARPAAAGEFTRRAFLEGRLDLTQAEAVAQIIAARSDRALRNAQALLAGELGRRLALVREDLLALAAELEAAIDFAEELGAGRDEASGAALLGGASNGAPALAGALCPAAGVERAHEQIAAKLTALAASYRRGRRLDGALVVLVGPVNAGKSSLFNSLLGAQRAIVSAEPGTTRDFIEEEVCWNGVRFRLVDTAGTRPPSELSATERAGHALAEPLLRACDLRLHVVDLTAPLDPAELPSFSSPSPAVPALIVANKVDAAGERAVDGLRGATSLPVVPTSARDGTGLDELQRTVSEQLGLAEAEAEESVLVARERQWEALVRAGEAMMAGCEALRGGLGPDLVVEHTREALAALDEITGERHSEAVLERVFASFCIGK